MCNVYHCCLEPETWSSSLICNQLNHDPIKTYNVLLTMSESNIINTWSFMSCVSSIYIRLSEIYRNTDIHYTNYFSTKSAICSNIQHHDWKFCASGNNCAFLRRTFSFHKSLFMQGQTLWMHIFLQLFVHVTAINATHWKHKQPVWI